MKKLILKTALITLGVTFLLSLALFGILSLAAPALMMNFTASLGMESVSGDYAWQEYERTGDIDCLARAFVIAAERGNDKVADARFNALYADENFSSYCEEISLEGNAPAYSFRSYLVGSAARVKYRLASQEKSEILAFALGETESSFPAGNPLVALSIEAVQEGDEAFCAEILDALLTGNFEESGEFNSLVKLLAGNVSA